MEKSNEPTDELQLLDSLGGCPFVKQDKNNHRSCSLIPIGDTFNLPCDGKNIECRVCKELIRIYNKGKDDGARETVEKMTALIESPGVGK